MLLQQRQDAHGWAPSVQSPPTDLSRFLSHRSYWSAKQLENECAELASILNCRILWTAQYLRPEVAHLADRDLHTILSSYRCLAKAQAIMTSGIASVEDMRKGEDCYRTFLRTKLALFGRDVVGKQRSYAIPLEAALKFSYFGSYEHGEEPWEV